MELWVPGDPQVMFWLQAFSELLEFSESQEPRELPMRVDSWLPFELRVPRELLALLKQEALWGLQVLCGLPASSGL